MNFYFELVVDQKVFHSNLFEEEFMLPVHDHKQASPRLGFKRRHFGGVH